MEGPWVPAGWVGGDEASGTVPGEQKQHFCYSALVLLYQDSYNSVPGSPELVQ